MAAEELLSARLDASEVLRGFDRMAGAAKDLRAVWASLRKPMRVDQTDHARKQSGPEGRWASRSPKTELRARQMRSGHRKAVKAAKTKGKFMNKPRRQFRARRLLGSLPNRTVKVQHLGGDGLMAISKVAWSGVQQDGGRVGRGSRIPARPFLWVSDGLFALAEKAIVEHVTGAF